MKHLCLLSCITDTWRAYPSGGDVADLFHLLPRPSGLTQLAWVSLHGNMKQTGLPGAVAEPVQVLGQPQVELQK